MTMTEPNATVTVNGETWTQAFGVKSGVPFWSTRTSTHVVCFAEDNQEPFLDHILALQWENDALRKEHERMSDELRGVYAEHPLNAVCNELRGHVAVLTRELAEARPRPASVNNPNDESHQSTPTTEGGRMNTAPLPKVNDAAERVAAEVGAAHVLLNLMRERRASHYTVERVTEELALKIGHLMLRARPMPTRCSDGVDQHDGGVILDAFNRLGKE